MVSQGGISRTKELASHLKDLAAIMGELQKYRKLCHKNFTHKDHGEEVQLLMWAHNEDGQLCAVVCSTAMPQVKEILRVPVFFAKYTCADPERATFMQTEYESIVREAI